MISIDVVKEYFRTALANEWFVIDKTGVKMIELVGESFLADRPAIFGTVNQEYVQHELDWYLSTSLNVNDIPGGPPKIWQQVSDENGFINSNYGWCIFHPDNGFQYDRAKEELINNPWSRRAIMIYNRPTMHMDYNANGMSDFMCTNAVQYMIRDGKLNAVVQMRSNDVVFGYKNDYAWQKFVLDKLAADLEVTPGRIIWNAGSLHVYERHFKLVV
jgi:thymidylate synthase